MGYEHLVHTLKAIEITAPQYGYPAFMTLDLGAIALSMMRVEGWGQHVGHDKPVDVWARAEQLVRSARPPRTAGTEASMRDPDALISTADLAGRLGQPGLRIYDCTTYLEPPDPGSPDPYKVVAGRKTFVAGHIPGADFLDLQAELSASDTPLKFMMPSPEHLAGAFGRHGLGDGARVVLYSIGSMMWATRVWWMLRSQGFDGAAVLDGGLDRWQAEGRPLETGEPAGYPPATFTPRPRPGRFVDKTAVRAAIGDPRTVTVNALGPQAHRGLETRYGRPGRVPGSVNVPAASLVDPVTKRFVAPADALAAFAAAGIAKDKRVIAYCGGGISATIDLFLLHQLGFDDLTLYDGSMGEWAKDQSLPIETG